MRPRCSGSSCSGTAARAAAGRSSRREADLPLPPQTCYSPRATSSHTMGEAPLLLVVDDDPSVLLLVDVLAEKMGFRVKAVSNGLQALEHLRDGLQPSVILLDIMMERIDGLTFMNHLHRRRARGNARRRDEHGGG